MAPRVRAQVLRALSFQARSLRGKLIVPLEGTGRDLHSSGVVPGQLPVRAHQSAPLEPIWSPSPGTCSLA